MEAIVTRISFSFDKIIVELSGMEYLYFINPEQVDWYKNDEHCNYIRAELSVGSNISFDLISNKTRNLTNIKIL